MKTHGTSSAALIPIERIERTIVRLRGHNVMFDADLAALYGVTTKRLNEQVKRNARRFPADFMFQLTQKEDADLRSQIATSSSVAHGGRRHVPYVFTEHGAKYDAQFQVVFQVIRELMAPPPAPRKRIGFRPVKSSS